MTVRLGLLYRDKTFGFEGVATSITQYMTGCDRVALSRMKNDEIKCEVFDVTQLELVESQHEDRASSVEDKSKGGPSPIPAARSFR